MKGEIELAVDKLTFTIGVNSKNKQRIKGSFEIVDKEGEGSGFSIQDLSRPLYWQKQGAPMYVKIGSRQLCLDLKSERVEYQLALVDGQTSSAKKTVEQFEKEETAARAAEEAQARKDSLASTLIRAGEPIAGAVSKVYCRCGYVPTKEELEEQGEGLCLACGLPIDKDFARLQSGSNLEQPAPEKKKRTRKSKAVVTTTPPVTELSPETQATVTELAGKAADQLEKVVESMDRKQPVGAGVA